MIDVNDFLAIFVDRGVGCRPIELGRLGEAHDTLVVDVVDL